MNFASTALPSAFRASRPLQIAAHYGDRALAVRFAARRARSAEQAVPRQEQLLSLLGRLPRAGRQ